LILAEREMAQIPAYRAIISCNFRLTPYLPVYTAESCPQGKEDPGQVSTEMKETTMRGFSHRKLDRVFLEYSGNSGADPARAIIQAGITEVVLSADVCDAYDDLHYRERHAAAATMLSEAGIAVRRAGLEG
jgi:hypothetical protein